MEGERAKVRESKTERERERAFVAVLLIEYKI